MNGSAALPPVNESQASTAPGALSQGHAQNPSTQAGQGAPAAKPGLGSAGQSPAGGTNHSASGSGSPETTSSLSEPEGGSDGTGRVTTTPIALPKDGHFGSVLVNDDLEQQFPEVAGVWNARIAYTAYLHVGLPKNWIMQYSMVRNTAAAAGGTVSRVDAPWPYNIVRPNLPPGAIDADALMIRGFVNESGRFEDLTVVFPQPFADAQFVLAALQQWQFRPAFAERCGSQSRSFAHHPRRRAIGRRSLLATLATLPQEGTDFTSVPFASCSIFLGVAICCWNHPRSRSRRRQWRGSYRSIA